MADEHAAPAADATHDAAHGSDHAADGMVGPHGSMDDHGDDHGHDDHAHGEEPVEKIDLPAWGAGVLGVLLGIAVVVALVLATGGLH
ncbi:MAG TPA: hypothetical protein VGI98_06305 [Candidatus Limnocylindrales bacterium]